MRGEKLSLRMQRSAPCAAAQATMRGNAGSMSTYDMNRWSSSGETRRSPSCRRRHSGVLIRPACHSASQSRQDSLAEYRSITRSRTSPSVIVLSKSKNRAGPVERLGMSQGLVVYERAFEERQTKARHRRRNFRAIEVRGDHVVGIGEHHELGAVRMDVFEDVVRIARARQIIILRLQQQERCAHLREAVPAQRNEVTHLAEEPQGEMCVAQFRDSGVVAQRRPFVGGRDTLAQNLILEAVRGLLAQIKEVFDRKVVSKRNQALRPWHIPAVVEERWRKAYNARHAVGVLRRDDEREHRSQRKTPYHERHAVGFGARARGTEVPTCALEQFLPARPRQHAERLAVIHEPPAFDAKLPPMTHEACRVGEFGRRSRETVQQQDAASGRAYQDNFVVRFSESGLIPEPGKFDLHRVLRTAVTAARCPLAKCAIVEFKRPRS